MVYHARRYLDSSRSYSLTNMCGVETFKVRKWPSKLMQNIYYVKFHGMYLSYHGPIFLKLGMLEDNVILKIPC